MNIRIQRVSLKAEVILFNEEEKKVIVLAGGEKQIEFNNKHIIPMYSKGRLFNFKMEYKGEYYQSYVIGREKYIVAIGHILDRMSEEEILKAIENNEFNEVNSNEESDVLVLYFNE